MAGIAVGSEEGDVGTRAEVGMMDLELGRFVAVAEPIGSGRMVPQATRKAIRTIQIYRCAVSFMAISHIQRSKIVVLAALRRLKPATYT